MTIIAIANQKGGVGKTTTTVMLGHGVAMTGKRVLIVDLDCQGNVADSLGLDAGHELDDLVKGVAVERIRVNARPNLDVIRSDKSTALTKVFLASMDFREYVLANALEGYDYDLVLFDCAPSVDILHTAALVAADYLIIPTKLDQFSSKGVAEMLRSLKSVQRASATNCRLAGIIPTFFDRVTTESHEQLVNLAEAFHELLWPPVPVDDNIRKATRHGKTLWETSPKSRGIVGYKSNGQTGGYQLIVDRLIKLIKE